MSLKKSKSFNINENNTRLFKYSVPLNPLGSGSYSTLGVSIGDVNYRDENGVLVMLDDSVYTIEEYIEDEDFITALTKMLFDIDMDYDTRRLFLYPIKLLYPICKHQVNKLSKQLGDNFILDYLVEPFKAIYNIGNNFDCMSISYKSYSYNLICNAVGLYLKMVKNLKTLVEQRHLFAEVDDILMRPFCYIIAAVNINEWVKIPEFCNSFIKQDDDSKKVYMALENGDIVISKSDKYNDKSFDSRYCYVCIGVNNSGLF